MSRLLKSAERILEEVAIFQIFRPIFQMSDFYPKSIWDQLAWRPQKTLSLPIGSNPVNALKDLLDNFVNLAHPATRGP